MGSLLQRKDNIMAKEKGQTCGTLRVTLVSILVISYIVLYSLFLTFPLAIFCASHLIGWMLSISFLLPLYCLSFAANFPFHCWCLQTCLYYITLMMTITGLVVWYLQQYFGHIVEETGISGENHWSAASY
jgi:hypothetical protein